MPRLLEVLIGRNTDPVVRVERIKLMASGTQLVAIGILVGSFVSPFFNPGLPIPLWARFGAATVAGLLELLALRILGYLAPASPEED